MATTWLFVYDVAIMGRCTTHRCLKYNLILLHSNMDLMFAWCLKNFLQFRDRRISDTSLGRFLNSFVKWNTCWKTSLSSSLFFSLTLASLCDTFLCFTQKIQQPIRMTSGASFSTCGHSVSKACPNVFFLRAFILFAPTQKIRLNFQWFCLELLTPAAPEMKHRKHTCPLL